MGTAVVVGWLPAKPKVLDASASFAAQVPAAMAAAAVAADTTARFTRSPTSPRL